MRLDSFIPFDVAILRLTFEALDSCNYNWFTIISKSFMEVNSPNYNLPTMLKRLACYSLT